MLIVFIYYVFVISTLFTIVCRILPGDGLPMVQVEILVCNFVAYCTELSFGPAGVSVVFGEVGHSGLFKGERGRELPCALKDLVGYHLSPFLIQTYAIT